MSDHDQPNASDSDPTVRRVGRRDRKTRIPRRGALFPTETPRDTSSEEDTRWRPPSQPQEAAAAPPTAEQPEADAERPLSAEESAWLIPPRQEPSAPKPAPAQPPRPRRPTGERYPPLPDELEKLERRDRARAAARRPIPPPPAWIGQVTGVFLLLSLGLAVYFGAIWFDPYSPVNLFAPPTPIPIVVSMTPTASPTPTPTATLTPSPTMTPTATPTIMPTATFTPIPAEALGVTPGVTPLAGDALTPFVLIPGGLVYIANPEARGGCNWSSIAGSVQAFDGAAVDGYTVRIQGEGADSVVLSGSNRGFGAGGFELPLGDSARDAAYTVTLFDPSGRQVSAPVTATTRADCANITAVRFVALE
jgi:hypothetical protein